MKKFKFRGKKYAWNWSESSLHNAGGLIVDLVGTALLVAGMWATVCLFAAIPLD